MSNLKPCVIKTMNDLISRQMAIDAILHNQKVYSNNFSSDDPIDRYTIAIIDNDAQTIAQLPTAERKGYWIDIGSGQKCSECGEIQYGYDSYRYYCQNCGSKNAGME